MHLAAELFDAEASLASLSPFCAFHLSCAKADDVISGVGQLPDMFKTRPIFGLNPETCLVGDFAQVLRALQLVEAGDADFESLVSTVVKIRTYLRGRSHTDSTTGVAAAATADVEKVAFIRDDLPMMDAGDVTFPSSIALYGPPGSGRSCVAFDMVNMWMHRFDRVHIFPGIRSKHLFRQLASERCKVHADNTDNVEIVNTFIQQCMVIASSVASCGERLSVCIVIDCDNSYDLTLRLKLDVTKAAELGISFIVTSYLPISNNFGVVGIIGKLKRTYAKEIYGGLPLLKQIFKDSTEMINALENKKGSCLFANHQQQRLYRGQLGRLMTPPTGNAEYDLPSHSSLDEDPPSFEDAMPKQPKTLLSSQVLPTIQPASFTLPMSMILYGSSATTFDLMRGGLYDEFDEVHVFADDERMTARFKQIARSAKQVAPNKYRHHRWSDKEREMKSVAEWAIRCYKKSGLKPKVCIVTREVPETVIDDLLRARQCGLSVIVVVGRGSRTAPKAFRQNCSYVALGGSPPNRGVSNQVYVENKDLMSDCGIVDYSSLHELVTANKNHLLVIERIATIVRRILLDRDWDMEAAVSEGEAVAATTTAATTTAVTTTAATTTAVTNTAATTATTTTALPHTVNQLEVSELLIDDKFPLPLSMLLYGQPIHAANLIRRLQPLFDGVYLFTDDVDTRSAFDDKNCRLGDRYMFTEAQLFDRVDPIIKCSENVKRLNPTLSVHLCVVIQRSNNNKLDDNRVFQSMLQRLDAAAVSYIIIVNKTNRSAHIDVRKHIKTIAFYSDDDSSRIYSENTSVFASFGISSLNSLTQTVKSLPLERVLLILCPSTNEMLYTRSPPTIAAATAASSSATQDLEKTQPTREVLVAPTNQETASGVTDVPANLSFKFTVKDDSTVVVMGAIGKLVTCVATQGKLPLYANHILELDAPAPPQFHGIKTIRYFGILKCHSIIRPGDTFVMCLESSDTISDVATARIMFANSQYNVSNDYPFSIHKSACVAPLEVTSANCCIKRR